jgi:hypothetical protein
MTPRQQRLILVSVISAAVGFYVVSHRWQVPAEFSDLTQVWLGARAWLHGEDPYGVVQSSGSWPYPLLYPFPAVVAVMPLALLPRWLADALFASVGAALLTIALTRNQIISPRLLVLVSPAFLYAAALVQWSPLLTGAAMLPWAGFLLVCKPTIGLALFAAFPRWQAAVGAGLLVAFSFVLWPDWIGHWRRVLTEAPNAIAPVTLWGGFLLPLVLLKWRRPESRLLAVLACVPHTTLIYEAVPLFLVPATWVEAWVVWAGVFFAFIGHRITEPYASQKAWVEASGVWLVLCAYLPCLVIILRRPNVPPP